MRATASPTAAVVEPSALGVAWLLADAPPPAWPPAGRTSANGKDLDSLAEPVAGGGDEPLFTSLKEEEVRPETAEAIRQLDLTDDAQVKDEAVCRDVAQVLLRLGQSQLLQRLALTRHMHYVLRVDMYADRVAVLERIGASWPRNASVVVHVSTDLKAPQVLALAPFLACPDQLDVVLSSGYHSGPQEHAAWAQTLKQKRLHQLSLCGSGFEFELIVALTGLAAKALVLSQCTAPLLLLTPAEEDVPDAAKKYGPNEAYEAALVALVSGSGASELDVSGRYLGSELALRMLSSRPVWELVWVDGNAALFTRLALGTCQIATLVLETPECAPSMRTLNAAEVAALSASGVHTLEFVAPVDLMGVVHALDAHARKTKSATGFLNRLIGCFVLTEDANVQRLVDLHRYNRPCNALVHKPMPWVAPEWDWVFDSDTLGRLNAINALNASAKGAPDPGKAEALQRTWIEAVQAISELLSPLRSLRDLDAYMKAPPQWVVPPARVEPRVLSHPLPWVLFEKLRTLHASGLDEDKLREVIGHRLRADPSLMNEMCRVLIATQRDMSHWGGDAAWSGLARERQHRGWSERMTTDHMKAAAPSVSVWSGGPTASDVPLERVKLETLVTPATAEGVGQFRISMLMKLAHPLANPRQHLAMVAAINQFVWSDFSAELEHRRLSPLVADSMARLLVELDQPKLLHHLVPSGTDWSLRATSPEAVATLANLAPWPDANAQCHLHLNSSLSAEAVLGLKNLALSVAADQLTVAIHVEANTAPGFLEAVRTLLQGRSGVALGLSVNPGSNLAEAAWRALAQFLDSIQDTGLRELSLSDIPCPYVVFDDAVVRAIRRLDVTSLSLAGIGEQLAVQVLAMRPWRKLALEPSRTIVETLAFFQEKPQSLQAETLCFMLDAGYDWENVETIFQQYNGLAELQFVNEPINVLAMAQLLTTKRGITALTCALAMNGPAEVAQALALMETYQFLSKIEEADDVAFRFGGPLPLDLMSRLNLMKLAVGNRLLRPDLVRRGAGRGFGVSTEGRFGANLDVFEHIGSFLDIRSALALSGTSKAAYLASRRGMQKEINRLAKLLAPEVPFKTFLKAIQAQVSSGLLHAMPEQWTDAGSIFDRQWFLRQAGVPNAMVNRVIAHRLSALMAPADSENRLLSEEEGKQVWQLLGGLASEGAIPARVWLEKGLGISLAGPQTQGLAEAQ